MGWGSIYTQNTGILALHCSVLDWELQCNVNLINATAQSQLQYNAVHWILCIVSGGSVPMDEVVILKKAAIVAERRVRPPIDWDNSLMIIWWWCWLWWRWWWLLLLLSWGSWRSHSTIFWYSSQCGSKYWREKRTRLMIEHDVVWCWNISMIDKKF